MTVSRPGSRVKKNLPLTDWRSRLSEISCLNTENVNSLLAGERQNSDKSALDRLNELIGLAQVKRQVQELTAVATTKYGASFGGTLHAAFIGNPGTGQTTVAQLVGEIYREIGLLERGHTVEAKNRSHLVAEYQGQSSPRTNSLIDQALDGVLFIDEAYTLSRGGPHDFGAEAVDQPLKMMEDYRDRLVVIVAGYPAEMRGFIEANPGLKSRFTQYVQFEDYTPQELSAIFIRMCQNQHYDLTPEAEQRLNHYTRLICAQKGKDFGNGREMRNLFQAVQERQALCLTRLAQPGAEAICTFLLENFP